jgi:uncharacterized protein YneF (UPF0154 family)
MSDKTKEVLSVIVMVLMTFVAGFLTGYTMGTQQAQEHLRDSIQLTEQAQTKALKCLEIMKR